MNEKMINEKLKKYSIDEFIKLTKENPLKWITYCEIIIVPSGSIIITNPCHVTTLERYAFELTGISREELYNEIPDDCMPIEWLVDKYNCVAVWYSGYMYPSRLFNRFQKRTLKILEENNLIMKKEDAFIMPATEYGRWLNSQKSMED